MCTKANCKKHYASPLTERMNGTANKVKVNCSLTALHLLALQFSHSFSFVQHCRRAECHVLREKLIKKAECNSHFKCMQGTHILVERRILAHLSAQQQSIIAHQNSPQPKLIWMKCSLWISRRIVLHKSIGNRLCEWRRQYRLEEWLHIKLTLLTHCSVDWTAHFRTHTTAFQFDI